MEDSAGNILLYVDISATDTPNYEQMCPMNMGFDDGENLETWNDLCSKFANNVVTSLDPTWSPTFKFDKNDPVAQFIIDKKFKTGLNRTAKVRIVNLLEGENGKQVDFRATFSGINYTNDNTVWEISFDFKIYKNTTFVISDYVEPSV